MTARTAFTADLCPTGPELTQLQSDVYDALASAMPGGFTRSELVSKLADTSITRVSELRTMGADIPVAKSRGKAYYRLGSLNWLTPDPVVLGVKARCGAASGLEVSLYRDCRGKLKPRVEAKLLTRIRSAMEEAIATIGAEAVDEGDDEDVEPDDRDLDDYRAWHDTDEEE